jgi:hypothetical protein
MKMNETEAEGASDWFWDHVKPNLDDIKEKYGLYNVEEIKEMITKIENPYPEDLFKEITAHEWGVIHAWLKMNMGFTLDRVSGNLMRKGFEVCKTDMLKTMEDLE